MYNIIGILDGEESDIGFFGMSETESDIICPNPKKQIQFFRIPKNAISDDSTSNNAYILNYSYHKKINYF